VTRRLETPEEATARLAAGSLTAPERAELWQRIEASTAAPAWHGRRGVRIAAWAAAPALAVAALLVVVLSRPQPAQHARQPIADACRLDPGAQRLALPERCAAAAVQVEGDEWLIAGGAQVARAEGGARVVEGRVRFRVRHRARSSFRVKVSHGEVRVIGTVFQIEQLAARGTVSVSEGVIEFVWHDGTRERVAAGQTLHWPRVAPPATPAAADAGAGSARGASAPAKSLDLDRVTARLLQLQSQKRHGEAVALLRETLARNRLAPLQRERISYELGLALEASGQPSCAHWKRHVAGFGAQRHAAELAERLERCRAR